MRKEEQLAIIEEKLKKLGTEELMYVFGAANAFALTQQQKNKEKNPLAHAL